MRKAKALLEIFLVVSLSLIISFFNSQTVNAQPTLEEIPDTSEVVASTGLVCCEKTINNEYCQYVDGSECDTGLRDIADPNKGSYSLAPTSCENTNFCKPGCCFDKEGDGYCYANYPRSNCEFQYGGKFSTDPTCSQTPECEQGCCVLGTQAFLSTEIKCKTQTSQYPDLAMDFRKEINTETECSNLARRADKGCCVSDSGCSFGSRQECTVTEGNGNGFFKDTFCSGVGKCNCAPANPQTGGAGDSESTRCVDWDDSVYWKDSCGNAEGVKESCDFAQGTICGDSDENEAFTCEDLDCDPQEDSLSFSLEGYQGTKQDLLTQGDNLVRNGESWCQFDAASQDLSKEALAENGFATSRSPVGSRYYRSLCINGKELIEPCKDYRQEYCVSGTITANIQGRQEQFTEARCIQNEWQSCVDECNTANSFTMDEEQYQRALEKDRDCCGQLDKRDCSWIGRCVPAVGPGFKFDQGEGTNVCGKASMECPVVLACNGWNAVLGSCETDGAGRWIAGIGTTVVAVAAAAALAYFTAGAGAAAWGALFTSASLGIEHATENPGWHVVSGQECLSKEYLQSANNLCRSYGDCGANVNYEGDFSLAGFSYTDKLPEEFKNAALHLSDLPDERQAAENFAYKNKDTVADNPGKLETTDLNRWPETCDSQNSETCISKQPFFQFTYPEKVGFWDRHYYRGLLGLEKWGPFALGGAFGAAAGSAVGATFGGILVGTGPAGKIITVLSSFGTDKITNQVATYNEKLGQQLIQEETKKLPEKVVEGGLNTEQQKIFQNALKEQLAGIEGVGKERASQWAENIATDGSKEFFAEPLGDEVSEEAINQAVEEAQKETLKQLGTQAEAEFASFAAAAEGANAAAWVVLAYNLVDTVAAETTVQKVNSICAPWQAPPVKGQEDQCERCNAEGYLDNSGNPTSAKALKACSEYRCKSLGASCQLINQGTTDEQCVSLSKFDVNSPEITPWIEGFDEDYQNAIDEDPDREGLRISREIPIYTTIRVAISTDEPSQCKMSFESGKKYDEMQPFYFGGPSYTYYHTQPIFYPGRPEVKNGNIQIEKGSGEYTVFVKCQDAQENANERDYSIKFNIGAEPDATAPIILNTSIGQEVFVTTGTTQTDVDVIINEPSECRWGLTPTAYKDMPTANQCRTTLAPDRFGNYNCRFVADGPGDTGPALKELPQAAGESKFFYFKCQDFATPTPNFNQEPFTLTIKGSNPLEITSVQPEGDIKTNLQQNNVTLIVKTANGARQDGTATCRFTTRESLKENIPGMDDTLISTGSTHTYPLVLPTGQHTLYVGCYDEAGNVGYAQTIFSLTTDASAPTITRAFRTDTGFVIVTDEDADCEESTTNSNFAFGEGNRLLKDGNYHTSLSESSIYYFRCKDAFGNIASVTTINVVNQA